MAENKSQAIPLIKEASITVQLIEGENRKNHRKLRWTRLYRLEVDDVVHVADDLHDYWSTLRGRN